MFRQEIANRTLKISYKNSCGTGFIITRNDRQYLITAKHVVNGICSGEIIKVFMNSGPEPLVVDVVGLKQGDIDVVVLSPRLNITAKSNVEYDGGIYIGQEVYFLGFPFSESYAVESLSPIPFPFIKRAIISGIEKNNDGSEKFILDGINNEGFSGGPVYCRDLSLKEPTYKIIAIISGYKAKNTLIKIDLENSHPYWVNLINKFFGTRLYTQENTGLIISYPIKEALDIIDANPIGMKIG